jgi:arylsulfatase A-like enzyme
MDWYPSLLEWCGIKKPDVVLDGHSLQPVIDSAEGARRSRSPSFPMEE